MVCTRGAIGTVVVHIRFVEDNANDQLNIRRMSMQWNTIETNEGYDDRLAVLEHNCCDQE
jgi:hypothetical protein